MTYIQNVGLMRRLLRRSALLPLLFFLFLISSCATTGPNNDPLEPVNRKIQQFNDTVDTYAMKPIAQGYAYVFPEFIRIALRNVFDNITYPTVFLNQFLQGKWETGLEDMARFTYNTTFGLAGLIDVATMMGLPAHDEDFGQTFAVWGFGEGPYLVLPLMGPSTLRDGVGRGVGWFTYPPNYIDDESTMWAVIAAQTIVERERVLEKEKLITGDRYLFLRDAYLQNRRYLIEDGHTVEDPFLSD